MLLQDFFELLFPKDELTRHIITQPTNRQWMEALESQLKPIKTSRSQLLSVPGNIPDRIYFATEGAIKGYRYHNEKQQVVYLWDGMSVIADVFNFVQQTPSDIYIQVIQDAPLFMLEKPVLHNILKEYPESTLLITSILLKVGTYHREKHYEFQALNAIEKFDNLFSTRKKIDMTFQKNDIASFLGLSRSAFSGLYHRKRR